MKARNMLSDLKTGNKVCLLKKSLYGLRQAGRSWYTRISEVLKNFGAKASNADHCVYYIGQGEDALIIAIYVDDISTISRNKTKIEKFKEALSKEFEIKDLGEPTCCLGIELSSPMDTNVKMIKEEDKSNDDESKPPFRELVGALMYLGVATRPDIAHVVSALSQFNSSFGQTHWTTAKRVLRYLKGTINLGLSYQSSEGQLEGFVDADWASCLVDRKSYTGYVFTLNNGAISWNSCKQRTVALSSTEAEYMGLTEITKEAIYLRGFLLELGFRGPEAVKISNDNMGALKLTENPVYHARSKHIDV